MSKKKRKFALVCSLPKGKPGHHHDCEHNRPNWPIEHICSTRSHDEQVRCDDPKCPRRR